jgi:hypothetical protein
MHNCFRRLTNDTTLRDMSLRTSCRRLMDAGHALAPDRHVRAIEVLLRTCQRAARGCDA